MSQRTIRGAITTNNTKNDILSDTKKMLEAIMIENNVKVDDIISILFTATKDITKVYPAAAARELGITNASLMCMQEMYVEDSLENCIRCMATVNTDKAQAEIKHTYLNGAVVLRPDLSK